MVDKNQILRKLTELETHLKELKEFSDISVEAYKEDWKTQRIVERTLQIMIELCIDVAEHIISDAHMRLPTTYSDTFKVLYENHVIDQSLFNIMEKMAKFRNVVVHQYEKVDAEIIVTILRKSLNDFVVFKNAIINYLYR
ncbi:MAG: type VII toxin-antitoxin system HepT family RNase toxin [bacterium]